MKRQAGALGALLLVAACAPTGRETAETSDPIGTRPTDDCASVTSDAELAPGGTITGDPAIYAAKREGCPRFVVDVVPTGARLAIHFQSTPPARGCEGWMEHVRFYRIDRPETLASYSIAASPTCAFDRPRLGVKIDRDARYRIALSAHAGATPLPVSISVERTRP